MTALIFKAFGMIIPFLKEAFLNRNKFKRNKTIGILIITNIIAVAAFFFSGDVVMKLYKSNLTCKESVATLEEKLTTLTLKGQNDIEVQNRLLRILEKIENKESKK